MCWKCHQFISNEDINQQIKEGLEKKGGKGHHLLYYLK